MFIRPWLEALKSRWMPGNRLTKRRMSDQKPVEDRLESLEERALLAAYDLITVIPNQGVFLNDGAVLTEAPKEMTLRFSPGQSINANSLGSITIVRAGVDGTFDDPLTPAIESTDDVTVTPGFIGVGELPYEVIMRFAQNLSDDKYKIRIDTSTTSGLTTGSGDTLNGDLLPNGTRTAIKTFNFELDLGAQVEAVVPQPVIRSQVFTVSNSAALVNGDILTVTNGPYTTVFEFNTAPGNVLAGRVYVNRLGGDAAVANALATAINGIGAPGNVALTATVNTQNVTITGSAFEPTITFGNPVLNVTSPAGIVDRDQLILTLGATRIALEFNDTVSNNTVTLGYGRIDFSRTNLNQLSVGAAQASINAAIVAAINNPTNNPTQQIQAALVGTSIVLTGTTGTPVLTVKAASADAFLTEFASAALAKTVVNVFDASSLTDADTFTLSMGGTPLVFEFNNTAVNNFVSPGRIRINYTTGASALTIATAIRDAVNSVVNNPAQIISATLVGNSLAFTSRNGVPTASWTTVLPTPVFTQDFGALSQAQNKVVVYFNQDQLNTSIAQDPAYYRLIDTTGSVLLPASVTYQYNAINGLSIAVLTFPGATLSNGTYNLKVGVSSEPNSALGTAIQVGAVFDSQNYIANEYLGDGTGASNDSADVDLFQFSIASVGPVTLTLDAGATLDGVLTLLDSNGSTVVTAGNPTTATGLGGVAVLTTGNLPIGTYYVRISSANSTTGGYQLTIDADPAIAIGAGDDNSSYQTATNLGTLGAGGISTIGSIVPQGAFVLMPDMPGGSNEPGHRDLPFGAFTGLSAPELGHGTGTTGGPSAPGNIRELTYSFPVTYQAGTLGTLLNEITEEQKQIIRYIFQIYSAQAGVQFYEVPNGGAQQIVVGDLRAIVPTLPPPGPGGISGTPIVLNSIFYRNDNTYGGGFTSTAFHEIGHNLGLGHSYDIPSIQGGGTTVGTTEGVFTGDNDLVHLLRVLPNSSSDIDLYQFNVTQNGTLTAETIAERLAASNLLNTVLTLYRQEGTTRTVVARNDDFFSKDSGLEVAVTPGTYYIGVTSTGNDNYDPSISNSGFGGRSQGAYELKLDFKPDPVPAGGLRDQTGRLLDGDHNGLAGGEFETWFKVAPTVIVDKLAAPGGSGSVAAPYRTVAEGLANAPANGIVRIVGNGGADRDAGTLVDNVPYAIGRDYDVNQTPLADGATFQVPQGVTVMIDAGALVKVRGETIDVGTSSAGIDRSFGALQVLGTTVNHVTFTSWRDDAKGSIDDGTNGVATGADWGGIVFRQDSDVDPTVTPGVFLNTVNHATLQYGGGQVSVDGGTLAVYNVIDIKTSRPTITNNIIRNNADAAISANPDSFKADDGRIGPDIHGNTVIQNSTNGLFIRIDTPLGGSFETLNVIARFDDTDITHVITQNLILNGRPAGALSNEVSARLMIDPGTVIKLSGARIETGIGYSNLIAEGTAQNPIRFTSQQDDRYGAGGTFDVKNDGNTAPLPGNWSGIFVGQTSNASLDNVSITYAGGGSEIAGNTDNFNPIETLQGRLRVTNSLFEFNAGGQAATNRDGKGGNDSSTIFVRGAQPVLVNNVFRDNVGNVISINANSMQAVVKPDYGRSTGPVNAFTAYDDNYGPLVRLNKFANRASFASSSTLGMNVRSEELTIESIWDDTDIAHVVRGLIASSEFHTYGGLTLQSSPTGSLVVKLQGAAAGFLATGDPLEITDRIGGTVSVVGQPGFPVILTSLQDDSVSAGFKPNGFPQFDTNGNNNAGGASVGTPGDWSGLVFDQSSNDRNVALVNETEPALTQGNDINGTVGSPQALGNLAPNQNSGDENRRLGYEVHGFISPDSPGDVDVYSFIANSGTEVWIDTDFTSQRLDVMVELLNSAGVVLARSLNSQDEQLNPAAWLASGYAGTLAAGATVGNSNLNTLTKDPTLGVDFYTSNFHDAGFRAVLPVVGTPGALTTYFVRVRSQPVAGQETAAVPTGGNGLTSGAYQLQVRLKQVDEIPGSTVRYADIRYATNGIVLSGLPAHSPLVGEAAEASGDNNGPGGAQNLGPLLQTDRNTLSVSGSIQGSTDVDFYRFTVDYSQVQVAIPGPKFFPTVFDIDWADGLTRPDTLLAVYNADFELIYVGRESDQSDDQSAPNQGQDLDDLSRSSLGRLDPFIGSVNLLASATQANQPTTLTTYYVAVFSNGMLPTGLTANFNGNAAPETQRVRLEPVNSITRVVEDHIGFTGYTSQGSNVSPVAGPMFNITDSVSLQANVRAFTLSDVNLFVTSTSSLFVVDPFQGTTEINYDDYGNQTYQDIDMRSDGRLFAVRSSPGAPQAGALVELNTGNGTELSAASDGIGDVDGDGATQRFQSNNSASTALAFRRNGVASYDVVFYATADNDDYPGGAGVSKLYRGRPDGSAAWAGNSWGASGIITDAGGTITTLTTGLQMLNGTLWGVSAGNQLFQVSQQNSIANDGGTNVGNPDSANPAINAALTPRLVNGPILNFSALLNPGEQFRGVTDAPQNVENSAYADFLFIITSTGRIICVDPTAGTAAAALQPVFDSNGDRLADSNFLTTGVGSPTGLAFSPADFNLWHTTERRANEAGHGVNSTAGTVANPNVDNSRVPGGEGVNTTFGNEDLTSTEALGGASFYFGLEEYAAGAGGNYYQYDSGGQYGVMSSVSHEDLAANAAIGNNYNLPGGAAGSLVTNSFSLEGYTASDKPTLYFNYWLQTEGANGKQGDQMRDSARVYASTDNGETWSLVATNNSTLSADDAPDAELPAYLSTNRNASTKSNQGVQELYETSSWRQARVDLNDFVGSTQIKLRFDFSTSGRTGTVVDPVTGLRVPSNDPSAPTFQNDRGSAFGVGQGGSASPLKAQANTSEGFYIDDIIVGFASRGEMITAPADGAGYTNLDNDSLVGQGGRPTSDPDPTATQQLLTGEYQLEIRRGENYGVLVDPPTPQGLVIVSPTLDVNDRQTNGQTVRIGNNVTAGNTVTIYDGLITRTFEFGAGSGTNIPVAIGGSVGATADNLTAAINATFAGRNTVIAKAVSVATNSDRIDIFNAISVTGVGTNPTTTALAAESDPAGFPGTGNDYPVNSPIQVANVRNPFSAGTDGYYSLAGQIGNGPHPTADSDFFEVNMVQGQRLQVDLNITGGTGTSYAMGVIDSNFNIVAIAFDNRIDFVASANDTYFLGVFGDDGDVGTLPVDPFFTFSFPNPPPLATTGNDTFTYSLDIALGNTLPVALSVDSYVRQGDDNLERTQGQFIIENNTILNSSLNGIWIDDNTRVGSLPHPGAPINTQPQNTQRLLTGLYIQNNVIARSGTNGIFIEGDNSANLGPAVVPFVKIVNNTIYGGDVVNPAGGSTGVLVQNASPTLMNNVFVNLGTAIGGAVGSSEIEANLFQGNFTDGPRGNNALFGADTTGIQLFVDAVGDNFYPAASVGTIFNPIVDSSRNNFNDRSTYTAVTSQVGIPPSPILAPRFDRFGQLRVDDGGTPGPSNQPGLGSNPFQDRGAIERADFTGAVVIPVVPQDNDGAGMDYDPTLNTIWIDAANPVAPFVIQTQFVLQLIDIGIGIDDDTVDTDGRDFVLLRNGTPLVEGQDYFFTYNRNTNEAIFTSVSTFTLDSRYQIVLDAAGITDLAGNALQNNSTAPISPINPLLGTPFDTSLLYFTYVLTDGDNDGPVTSLAGVPAPVLPLTAPPATITEDSFATFNAAGFGRITVDDQDAFLAPDGDPNTGSQGGRIRVTVSIPNGMGRIELPAGSTANLVANGGATSTTGSPVYQIVLDGRIDDINTALDGLVFTPPADFPPDVSTTVNITFFTEDLGKFGPPAPGTTTPKATTTVIPVTVTPVNDAPTVTVVTSSPITILEDKVGATQIDLTNITAGGGETQSLLVSVTSSNTTLIPNGNITVNYPNLPLPAAQPTTGNIQFTAAANRFGTAILTITVRDAGLNGIFNDNDDLTTTRNVTVNVTAVNDTPTIDQPANATILEDAVTQTVTLTGISLGTFEFPGQTLTLTATSSDPSIIANPTITYVQGAPTATLTYTPGANRNGTVTITITAMDDGGTANGGVDTVVTTFDVTVIAVNDAPTVTVPANLTILEDAANNPQQLLLTGVSAGPFEGTQNITSISVTSNNQAVIPDANIVQGVLSGGNLPLTITPLADQFGLVTITVTITDDGANGGANGDVNTITRTFTINILPVNDTPTFDMVPTQTILEDAGQQTITLTNISAGPANESGQILTLSAISLDTNLIANPILVSSIVGGQATLQYTPVANQNGQVIIRVTLRDNGGTANGSIDTYTQDIVINITAVNDAPTLNAIANQPVTGLLLEDAGQQTINLSGITAGPSNENTQNLTVTAAITGGNPNLVNNFIGSVVAANGTATLRYTPVANEFGTATVTVTVTDSGANGGGNGDVNFTTRTFTITITPVNDVPTMDTIANQTVNEDAGQQSIALSGISVGPANEAPPQTLNFTLTSDNPALIPNDSGHLSIVYTQGNPNGQLLYTSVPNGFGVANITLTIRDTGGLTNGGGDTIVRTFRITVDQVPDEPSNINLVGNQVFENRPIGTAVGTLSTTDVDLPDDAFNYSIVGGTGLGFFGINGNQLVTAQVLDFEPPATNNYTVTVRSTDRFGLTTDRTFNVLVQNLNDAPTLDAIAPVAMNEDPLNPVIVNLTGITAGFGETHSLTVTATSDNPNLFANPIPVTYTSPNAAGTLSLMPLPNANGTATITVTVRDNGGTANGGIDTITRTFTVTVNAVNDAPTDINLSNDTIPEIVAGTPLPTSVPVGQLSAIDPDNPGAGDTFSYTLVGGVGSDDNANFAIMNDQLFAVGNIDFDTQPDYTIRVQVTDSGTPNLKFEKVLTIHSTNLNEPATSIGTGPNGITGIPNSIPENLPMGSIVGPLVALDPDAGDVSTFTLVSGAGATDNALFQIVGGNLIANVSFDFELKSSYSIRVRAVDSQGLSFETAVVINVTNVNEGPVQLNLSNSTVPENISVGANVGTLSTLDVDNPENFTYTLVAGAGSTDNARFTIVGDKLVVATPLNYEERLNHSYSVRVRVTDIGGLVIERAFTVTVTDVNEAPTNLTLAPTAVNENLAIGALVGTLTPTDEDSPDPYTYTFASGAGSEDNAAFQLNGNRLQTAVVFDFETKASYSVRIRGTDMAGHTIERQFTITINNTKDGPVIVLADPALTTTGRKPVFVDTGAQISDIDSPNFNGGKLRVYIQAGEQTGDVLTIAKERGRGAMVLKTVRGRTVLRLGKQDIATISGGSKGIPLEIQFGAGISQELFQRVMQRITFRGKPFAAPRQVAMQAFDELGIASNIEIRDIVVN